MSLYIERENEAVILFENKTNPWLSAKNMGNGACCITFYNENIPKECVYGAKDLPSELSVAVQCKSDEEAELCINDFADFIYQGYEKGTWILAPDIGDIEGFFGAIGQAKFIRYEISKWDLEKTIKEISQYLDGLSLPAGLLYIKQLIDFDDPDCDYYKAYHLLADHFSDILWYAVSATQDKDKIMIYLWI